MQRANILVVEDDPEVSDALSELLASHGYSVQVAGDGSSGLRLLHDGLRPSVILLDLAMPNMDGQRFRDMQREDPELARIPTVVMTSDTRFDPERLGVVACFRKPFDCDQLLQVIERLR